MQYFSLSLSSSILISEAKSANSESIYLKNSSVSDKDLLVGQPPTFVEEEATNCDGIRLL